MNGIKRGLAYLLCTAMISGMFQIPVSATETVLPVAQEQSEVIDAALFFSDLHTTQSDDKSGLIQEVMRGTLTSGLTFSSVTSVGDAFSSEETAYKSTTESITNSVRTGLGLESNIPVFYTWSDHDRGAEDIENYTGLMYGDSEEYAKYYDKDANYYIYAISMSDMSASERYGQPSTFTEEKLQAFAEVVETLDHSKPLFIASHQPLHDRRNDNEHAAEWYEVISAAADKMDVAFFWGHNHTSETIEDRNGFFVEKDGSEQMTIDGIGQVTPNFTYLNAGYLDSSDGAASARQNVVTAVGIYEDRITYTLYDKDGVYDSNSDYMLNTEVEREFAQDTSEEDGDVTEESPMPDVPKAVTAVVPGHGTEMIEKKAYVLVGTPSAGRKYIIASSGTAGDAYALKENDEAGEPIVIRERTESTSNVYIEIEEEENKAILWNASSGMKFQSEGAGVYLSYNNKALAFSDESGVNWHVRTNQAYYQVKGNEHYSLGCADGSWELYQERNVSGKYKVYFYEERTIDVEVEVEVDHILGISGTQKEIYKIVGPGSTMVLGSTLNLLDNNTEVVIDDISTEAAYEVVENGDPMKIISGIEGNVVTFSGNIGKALVRVCYTYVDETSGEEYLLDNYIVIETAEPTYKIDVTHDTDQNGTYEVVDRTIVIKKVTDETRYNLSCNVSYIDENGTEIIPAMVTWETNRPELATVDENGLVSFKEANGIVQITAIYTYADGKSITDTVAFSISIEEYITPNDGTGAFPEYPNEGSVRFDKTATAVGVFSETGVAQVELSMTGVPFTQGNTMDVALMLDHSNSMTTDRMEATRLATKAFIESIVINKDGSFNNNRIYVGSFAGGNPQYAGQSRHEFRIYEMTNAEQDGYQIINDRTELEALFDRIDSTYQKITTNTPYGTEYAQSLEKCYELLRASKEDGNKQYCVFMSDGIPNVYQYGEGADDQITSSSAMAEMFTGTDYDTRDTDYQYEYYSTLMKGDGVTVYTVGLALHGTNSSLSGANETECEHVANILLNDISGPAGEAQADTGTAVSKLDEYFYSVTEENAETEMSGVFSTISYKILEAARDVRVSDKIADKYTMVFDFPNDTVESKVPGQEFYIEAKSYDLVPVTQNGVVTNYHRGASESLLKLYIGTEEDGMSFYAAKDADGSRHETPVFTTAAMGNEYYWTLDENKGDVNIAVPGADGNTYYFAVKGDGTHNMISGAYASGSLDTTKNIVNDETSEVVGQSKTSENLIIATKYFVYDASSRMLVWTAEKLGTKELTLNYFLYLENSGGFVGNRDAIHEGTYETNDYAYLDYTNFQGVECEQTFPIPQMTWNGAQVSYVFYLVNRQGYPVNRAGHVIPFSEAVYVTDTYTYAVKWNEADAEGKLEAEYLADELVPDVYELYDEKAEYDIYVYETEDGINQNNHFVIEGSEDLAKTTYVFNTKADAEKYTDYHTYHEENVREGFDFSNTTVAFGVVWAAELREDVVVIDYGLPVDINVAANDNVNGVVSGLQMSGTGMFEANEYDPGIVINSGRVNDRLYFPTMLNKNMGMKYGQAEIISNESVRYTPTTMNMDSSEMFYYLTDLKFYNDQGIYESARLYSSITVVPASNIYYEDTTTFIEYQNGSFTWEEAGKQNISMTQESDRPGPDKIGALLDSDNVYGYDSAYLGNTSYSMGGSHKVTVSAGDQVTWPTAAFTFTGTAFDILSLTSNDTGTITVKVENVETGARKNWIVDTYYGYIYQADEENPYLKRTFIYGTDESWHMVSAEEVSTKDLQAGETMEVPAQPEIGDQFVTFENNGQWIVTEGENALYQIPVIKSPELEYGTYRVTISPRYAEVFDNAQKGSYDFYLDGVRIYNPAQGNTEIEDIYVQDGEGYPEYIEIRNALLGQEALAGEEALQGAVFIDGYGTDGSYEEYKTYGPNNEVYLKKGQAVAFRITDANSAQFAALHLGVKAPMGGTAKVTVAGAKNVDVTTNSATEQYFDITNAVSWDTQNTSNVLVLTNTSDGDAQVMVSLTNLKLTHKAAGTSRTVGFVMTKRDMEYAAAVVQEQYLADMPVETPEAVKAQKPVTEQFKDVVNTWYTDYVQYVYDKELMMGSDDKFMPDNTLTRAMVVTTLYRMAGSPKVNGNQACEALKDVQKGQWYTDAVCWAYEEGITTGYTDRQIFGVEDAVTREQIATFFYRYAQNAELDITANSNLQTLKNTDKMSDYAKEAVSWMVGAELLQGLEIIENGRTVYDLAPTQTGTRAQMAAILTRFCEAYGL